MTSYARSDGMTLSLEVPFSSTCKDLQSNSDVFGCDVKLNAIWSRYLQKKTANLQVFFFHFKNKRSQFYANVPT